MIVNCSNGVSEISTTVAVLKLLFGIVNLFRLDELM